MAWVGVVEVKTPTPTPTPNAKKRQRRVYEPRTTLYPARQRTVEINKIVKQLTLCYYNSQKHFLCTLFFFFNLQLIHIFFDL